jgi:uncharacterized membrane protein
MTVANGRNDRSAPIKKLSTTSPASKPILTQFSHAGKLPAAWVHKILGIMLPTSIMTHAKTTVLVFLEEGSVFEIDDIVSAAPGVSNKRDDVIRSYQVS